MDEDDLIITETWTTPGAEDVEHFHATLATLDADGGWVYALMESPDLADEWQTYEPFEPDGSTSDYVLMESPVLADDWPMYEDFEPAPVSLN
jgi:hypothetical protein